MKYSEKYDVYIDDDLVIYSYKYHSDKLTQNKIGSNGKYPTVTTKLGKCFIHRIVYETFVGEIPPDYQIDHINTIKTDYRLENLRLVTPKENMANPITREHLDHVLKNNRKDCLNGRKKTPVEPKTEFNRKFREHYNMVMADDPKLYDRERSWYRKHNKKCRWEN